MDIRNLIIHGVFDNFVNDYKGGLARAESRGKITDRAKREESFETNITNNMSGFAPMTQPSGTTPPAGGGTPPPTPSL